MGVYNRNGILYIDYYVGTKRVRESLKAGATKTLAQEVLRKRLTEVKEGKYFGIIKHDLSWSSVTEEHLEYIQVQHPKTHSRWQRYIKALELHFKNLSFNQINTNDVKMYISKRKNQHQLKSGKKKLKISTINREVTALKAMFNRLIKQNKLKFNPCNLIPKASEAHLSRDRFLTEEEYQRLLKVIDSPNIKLIVMIGYTTAMRKSEILNLKWSNLDLVKGIITLSDIETKTKQGRVIPLMDEILALLTEMKTKATCEWVFHKQGYPKPYNNITKVFNAYCSLAGVKDFVFHDLRHTCITNWIKKGLSQFYVMKLSGHTQTQTLKRYVNLQVDDVINALKGLNEKN